MITIMGGEFNGATIDFVTSDQHIGHENIIRFCDRPFEGSVSMMNTMLLMGWNNMVSPDSNILVLGDIALGNIEDSLRLWSYFNGTKFLVPGNHDRISSLYSEEKRARLRPLYEDAGFLILDETVALDIDGREALASHYPYKGDSKKDVERHAELRPVDEGLPLLHGHTHSKAVLTAEFPLQYHVGVDAHNFLPVPSAKIEEWVRSL